MKPHYKVYREASIFYFNAPFSDVPSFSKMSQSRSQNQQIIKQCCLPPLYFKISIKDTSFHVSINFLQCFISLQNACFCYLCPSPSFRTPGKTFLKICFPQDERGGGNCDLLYQNSVRKYENDLEHQLVYLNFV